MKIYWHNGNYPTTELNMTPAQIEAVSHSGDCDADTRGVMEEIKSQLIRIHPDELRKELSEYGAWNDKELENHEENLARWVWISGCELKDELREKGGSNMDTALNPLKALLSHEKIKASGNYWALRELELVLRDNLAEIESMQLAAKLGEARS